MLGFIAESGDAEGKIRRKLTPRNKYLVQEEKLIRKSTHFKKNSDDFCGETINSHSHSQLSDKSNC